MFTPFVDIGPSGFTLTPTDQGDRVDPAGAFDIGRDIVWSPSLGLFVLTAGQSGASAFLYSSTDAINFTARTIPVTDELLTTMRWIPELAKFVGLYVSVLTDGCLTSTDGINWSGFDLPTGADQFWDGIAYSASRDRLVSVSLGGGTDATRAIYSDDGGETWTLGTTPTGHGASWVGVTYSPSLDRFCACAVNGGTTQRLMTSDDGGETWAYRTAPVTGAWEEVEWSPELGLFCATSQTGQIITSPDGETWTARTSGVSVNIADVIWVAELGIFMAVTRTEAADANKILTSTNGIDWTLLDSPSDKLWKSVTYARALNMFAACEFSDPISILTIAVEPSG
jgi:hypothetical protein